MRDAELFITYKEDRKNLEISGFNLEVFENLIRYTPVVSGMEGIITFASLNKSTAPAEIEEQITYFEEKGLGFEWKVYDLDKPADMKSRLLDRGFVEEDEEAFMVYDLSGLPPDAMERKHIPVEILRVSDETGVKDVIQVQNLVWGKNLDWVGRQLMTELQTAPQCVSIYCAYIDGQPIATGWTHYPKNSKFPELHGGAVLPQWRGKGIYSALYKIRLVEAKNRGYQFMAVDASPMSRPILEKLGFTYVCSTTPLRKSAL